MSPSRFSSLALVLVVLGCGDDPPPPHCACQHDPASATHDHASLPPASALDGASIYQLDSSFTDQDEHAFTLSSLRGQPVLVVMFYGSCTTVCPLLLSEAVRVDQGLSEAERARLRVIFVTFDPENDTPDRLRALAAERSFPVPRYALLRGDDDAIRELAMALGVQYRRTGDGQFVHSAMVTLLDEEGRIAVQADGVDAPLEPLISRAHEIATTTGREAEGAVR